MNQSYTIADYLKWQFEERVELIKGKVFTLPTPNAMHQVILVELVWRLGNFLRKKPIKACMAPYDVYLTLPLKKDDTVVQPNVCVVCDPAKRQMKGCVGTLDIVVEILSPSNKIKEIRG